MKLIVEGNLLREPRGGARMVITQSLFPKNGKRLTF
jgi:hypothetical protein